MVLPLLIYHPKRSLSSESWLWTQPRAHAKHMFQPHALVWGPTLQQHRTQV